MKKIGDRKMIKYLKSKSAHWIIKTAVLVIMLVTLAYIIYRIATTPFSKEGGSPPWLMFWQCCLGIAGLFLPDLLERKFKLVIPSILITTYVILLFCSVYLGEIFSFYYRFQILGFRVWDVMLHLSYSAMLVLLGFSIIGLLNKAESVKLKFSPVWIVIFSFFFAITVDAAWEIFEFIMDSFFGFNMQKFRGADGTEYIGQAALLDTMKDFVVDFIGAGIMCVIALLTVKRTDTFFDAVVIRKKDGESENPVASMVHKKEKEGDK